MRKTTACIETMKQGDEYVVQSHTRAQYSRELVCGREDRRTGLYVHYTLGHIYI